MLRLTVQPVNVRKHVTLKTRIADLAVVFAAISMNERAEWAEFGSLWALFRNLEIVTTQNLQLHYTILAPCWLSKDKSGKEKHESRGFHYHPSVPKVYHQLQPVQ